MKPSSLLRLIPVTYLATSVAALSAAGWRSQSIYQVITDRFARTDGSTTASCNVNEYCGGSWQGIIKHLDYIQNMGFTADGSSYHGYWAQNIYQVNSNFGTPADLKALSAAKSYYHPFCLIDYNNATSVVDCWEGDNIVSLPDLRTEDSDVYTEWNSWISQLVANYSIDGLRVDSAQQTGKAFFPSFQNSAGVYVVGEIFNGDPAYVCPYQNYMNGVLNYPAYYWITQAFQSTSGSISNLVNGINTMKSSCSDTTLLGSFLENHDVARFPSYTSDASLTKNAIAFTILSDGIPIVYQGQEQHLTGSSVPNNREALWSNSNSYSQSATYYRFIASVNQIRNQAIYVDPTYLTYKAYPVYSDGTTIVMRKGFTGKQIIAVFSNKGASGSSYTLTLTSSQTGFTSNLQVVEVLTCTTSTTNGSGNLAVSMAGGVPRIFYPKSYLVGSGVCSL
ncbi:hypothetical protein SS1G_01776 [Sclerotinia sclerotiorum 1980 UF-70]|uniref:alpha-amylase n=1 Tax=Sclerotinia sclerotiorum (strain ATCC 18683 / 1980 / Ss-1) TaxID=665079 RepID=A7E8Z8_SCLS1|nr:hypothetical protein SS1G_01776 [Sclerotinia sclerotiorum 1980 UF-70]EDN96850.1 hypothetical protein SS1G_01776 [Sclerotinia sclerotiorum 1980 UF-70]